MRWLWGGCGMGMGWSSSSWLLVVVRERGINEDTALNITKRRMYREAIYGTKKIIQPWSDRPAVILSAGCEGFGILF